MVEKYNKLVRDNIPNIIKNSGKKVEYRVLNIKEYKEALKKKLIEEATELLGAKTRFSMMEELADIQEVLLAIYAVYGFRHQEIKNWGVKKAMLKGGFHKRYLLESVKE